MVLGMKYITGKADILPANDDVMITGPMSDCVSAIVLANKNVTGRYETIRGFHGLGGAGNINFDSLLNNLAHQDVVLCVFRGFLQRSEYAKERISVIVEEALNRNRITTTTQYFDYDNAQVNRLGKIISI